MNPFLLLIVLLVPTTLGLALAVTGLRSDMYLRHGTPYRQRGPALREHVAQRFSVSASVPTPGATHAAAR